MCQSCTCCTGYSIGKRYYTKSFSKRLLVAVSVFILIAMCLTPAEARSVEHKRRHQRKPENLAQITKDSSIKRLKNQAANSDQFKNATRMIKHKLRNTKRYFDQDRRVLNETREYRDGMPVWLPAVNFVDIHFHDYKTGRKGKSITERKFTYLMPKLYKTLKEYETIFHLLLKVQPELPDAPFANYMIVRRKLLVDTLDKLTSTIAEIQENMVSVNMQVPFFDKNRMNLDALKQKVDATQCLKNDYIAFRGYGNFLNNWYFEFRCPLNKKTDRKCAAYHAKMREKLGSKKNKNNKNNAPSTS